MRLNDIKTPAYVCEEAILENNLKILKNISDESGAKVLCALKGFAFSGGMELVAKYLNGATCSGLHEAKYAKFHGFKEVHTYSPAFSDDDIDEVLSLSHHVVFNSFAQWDKFKIKAIKSGKSIGLRINPEVSSSPTDMYNPCSKFSRLGITKVNFNEANIDGIDGLHFHALCEESARSLELVLCKFEEQFGNLIPKMKWINFGGGHHITKSGYDINLLIDLIKKFRKKYGVEVFIEPGEAVGWQCGFLISSVLDIVENEEKTCIIDASAECHMPDTVLMPYRPKMRGESSNGKFEYRFGGATCLAGDIVGAAAGDPIFKFDNEIKVGDKVIFEDQIHYTIVKNSTFNGVKLPNLVMISKSGEIKTVREFGYDEYSRRN
ncbi:carboxynorspermidine decarboxylase [Campylobacter fetus subsp. testudinum]|uniref:carboxynorspermidine decarboxylase n=1 Tax=Campylobacter fetus TaxID=196 RepID=UPI000818C99D|nr:carboxynorspermidine decarboxylase [Campylobacter fetus]OCR87563.1 carboxynorspermidine decarboxylase [Campylobacter fetus subsp. testudinum]OCR89514.1 carboxynorspermidine decarboxylase [Campylobacter fetus subsp. testudinum]OCR98427.1 carboxynorspermidine decarboxylase [Campylobacter fetus subsp. testudinum]OCS00767.1 carboxynorspermidine decarboxylase [Campylobacter fetus subsp. testudinum]OCS04115.1 carboxynorspermidine decarboxylase [Campylobacter fetus subsp. testudinum]